MAEPAFDFGAFLQNSTELDASGSADVTASANFGFDWLALSDGKATDTDAGTTAPSEASTGGPSDHSVDLPFFALEERGGCATADAHAPIPASASLPFASPEAPFAFLPPSTSLAFADLAWGDVPAATESTPNTLPTTSPTTPTTAMPPPSPLSPATRQKMKRAAQSTTTARDGSVPVRHNNRDEESEVDAEGEEEEARAVSNENEEDEIDVTNRTDEPAPPLHEKAMKTVTETGAIRTTIVAEALPPATATAMAIPVETNEESAARVAPSVAAPSVTPLSTAVKRRALSHHTSHAAPPAPRATASASSPETSIAVREVVAQSRQRLEQVRRRESQSRITTRTIFHSRQTGAPTYAAAHNAEKADDDVGAGAGAGASFSSSADVDCADTAFTASCAQLNRQVSQTRAEQLRVSEDVQLAATHVLSLFGPHAGLASLLGAEFAAVPAVQLLPLLVPFFEDLLRED